ncbi:MAG: diguanylate cyclase [Deltaproteobacteria bacterium]|nr:diguanylate cyclase [Deltaproteobacteria bacterium]
MKKARILVVDDDAFFRVLCTDILTGVGYDVVVASTGAEALNIVETEPVDVVITDLVMPDIGGLEVLQRTKQHNTFIDVIVITGYGSIETAIEALKNGAIDYIRKPLNGVEILHTVAACLEKKKLLEENLDMKQSLRLYEVTRVVTATLDTGRLYHTAIDALLQMVHADAGIVVFYAADGTTLETVAAKHLSPETAERFAGYLKERYAADLPGLKNATVVPLPGFDDAAPKEQAQTPANTALIAPVLKGERTAGFLILLGGSRVFGARDINNAAFIAQHVSTAYENALQYNEAKETAFIDSLTSLYNSKYLDIVLDKEMKRADRLLMPLTVLFIDIDNFKLINDLNDHLIGSKVLVEFGKVMLRFVREVDTVIRYGGDEYVVILVDADYDVAMRVAERIRAGIEQARFLAEDGLSIKITASIGVATYPIHAREKSELLKIADKAMYHAKNMSRNIVYLAPVPQARHTMKDMDAKKV